MQAQIALEAIYLKMMQFWTIQSFKPKRMVYIFNCLELRLL